MSEQCKTTSSLSDAQKRDRVGEDKEEVKRERDWNGRTTSLNQVTKGQRRIGRKKKNKKGEMD